MVLAQDETKQLRLLSIANYVFSVISVVLSLLPVAQLALGVGLFTLAKACTGSDCPPTWIGLVAIILSVSFIVFGLSDAVLSFLKARFLARQKHYRFCLFASYLQCLFFPFGTILGILAIMILQRESVKHSFLI